MLRPVGALCVAVLLACSMAMVGLLQDETHRPSSYMFHGIAYINLYTRLHIGIDISIWFYIRKPCSASGLRNIIPRENHGNIHGCEGLNTGNMMIA